MVVTGGSSGFGELVTLDLGRRGVRVVVVDVVEPKYEIRMTPFPLLINQLAKIPNVH